MIKLMTGFAVLASVVAAISVFVLYPVLLLIPGGLLVAGFCYAIGEEILGDDDDDYRSYGY